jgi:hypothetical protein
MSAVEIQSMWVYERENLFLMMSLKKLEEGHVMDHCWKNLTLMEGTNCVSEY